MLMLKILFLLALTTVQVDRNLLGCEQGLVQEAQAWDGKHCDNSCGAALLHHVASHPCLTRSPAMITDRKDRFEASVISMDTLMLNHTDVLMLASGRFTIMLQYIKNVTVTYGRWSTAPVLHHNDSKMQRNPQHHPLLTLIRLLQLIYTSIILFSYVAKRGKHIIRLVEDEPETVKEFSESLPSESLAESSTAETPTATSAKPKKSVSFGPVVTFFFISEEKGSRRPLPELRTSSVQVVQEGEPDICEDDEDLIQEEKYVNKLQLFNHDINPPEHVQPSNMNIDVKQSSHRLEPLTWETDVRKASLAGITDECGHDYLEGEPDCPENSAEFKEICSPRIAPLTWESVDKHSSPVGIPDECEPDCPKEIPTATSTKRKISVSFGPIVTFFFIGEGPHRLPPGPRTSSVQGLEEGEPDICEDEEDYSQEEEYPNTLDLFNRD